MKFTIDDIMANIPILFIVIVFIYLLYSEFSGVCVTGESVMEILHGVIVGHTVKVLG